MGERCCSLGKEKGTIAQCGAIQDVLGKEKRIMCNYPGETLLQELRLFDSDSRYVGRTSQRLQDRIKQHVPKWLQQQAKRPTRSQPGRCCKLKRNNPDCDSAIGQHLLDNEQCAANYNDKRFKILAVARNSFHLCLLEATFIKTKHPVLCKQKEFVYILKLFK